MPLRSFIASLLVVTLSGAPVSIGLISANGPLTVNHAAAWGNATLFEGTSVATAEASGDLALRNGVRIQLAAQSQAKIGEAQEVLEKGSSQVNAKQAYEVQARGLKIAAPAGSRVMIALKQANSVEVTAVAGGARVSDHAGLLLASIQPGRGVAFALPQDQPASAAPGATAVQRAGCLLYKDMHFILHDDATNEVIELNGSDLALNVGKSVQITGTPTTTKPAVSIATSVMNVNNVAPRSTGGCLVIAQALDAQTQVPGAAGAGAAPPPNPPAANTGLSTTAKTLIIIGVAGAGGIGAALALKGSSSH